MKSAKLFITFICILNSNLISGQSFTVTNSQSPSQLVGSLTGSGLITTNITSQISNVSTGSFVSTGVQGFSFQNGILLSTGELTNILGPASYHNSTDLGMPGSVLLDALVTPQLTQDAQILSFDFQAYSDSVEFNFVFSSEEYNDYTNTSFNDIFGFFVTGPGYSPNTNVALIPGTTTPISINNVNNGGPTSGTATGPCLNCAYYIDNVNTNAVGLSHDGYTVTMKIKFPIWPCSSYHFEIALADVSDGIFDSAIMFESNSFLACPVMQPFQNGIPASDTLYFCAGGVLKLDAPDAANYVWSTGDTTQAITITQPGSYQFYINVGSCYSYSNSIQVVQQGAIQTPVISQSGTQLVSSVLPTPGITYQWNLNGIPIAGATQNTLLIPGNGCYTQSVFEGTCESISNVVCITNTAVNEFTEKQIRIIPHPVTGISELETPFNDGTITTVTINDLTGRVLFSEKYFESSPILFDKKNMPSGLYLLSLSNNSYLHIVYKIIVVD